MKRICENNYIWLRLGDHQKQKIVNGKIKYEKSIHKFKNLNKEKQHIKKNKIQYRFV